MHIHRRQLLAIAMSGAALGLIGTSSSTAAAANVRIKAVAFDGFVIFDPRPIAVLAEALYPGKGAEIMTAWRTRQFEYTWLRTMTQSYVDFWRVTREALVFACKSLKLDLSNDNADKLMAAFLQLKAWPDVIPTLTSLKSSGARMAFLTNFSASMLDANIRSAGLEGFFEEHLSTDRVQAFKPDPRSYQMGVDHFKMRREEIVFAAFGGWDAAGAKRFGYPVFWCNRLRQPVEELGVVPDRIADSSAELPEFIASVNAA